MDDEEDDDEEDVVVVVVVSELIELMPESLSLVAGVVVFCCC